MSKIEVNAIEPQCGTTLTAGGGAGKTVVVDATTVTLGRCGGTVALASGASQTGFGRTGTVDWITTPKTATFSAVSGEGYFCNTSGGVITANLPAGVAGAIVSFADYAATWQTSNVTVAPNGTDKIGSQNQNAILDTEGQSVTFVYVDSTQGWINTMDSTSNVRGASFITATGGTPSQDGNYEIRTFTGPGTFCISAISNNADNNKIDYLVVAGGGAGSGPLVGDSAGSGGGGGGGFRLSNSTCMPAPLTSPLANPTGLTATVASFPITIGSGGTLTNFGGNPGSNSIFSTITSTGGGGGGSFPSAPTPLHSGQPGGSGGGAGRSPGPSSGGTGNTPPVSPPQGQNGGSGNQGAPNYGQGGGGGAGAVGSVAQAATPSVGGSGGIGSFAIATGFAGCNGTPGPVGSVRYFAGGGGGATYQGGTKGPGGAGGGGESNFSPNFGSSPGISGVSGETNTGGGGGGMSQSGNGGLGGSGIVIIRYKFQ
jgi:hypothetical protein